MSLKPENLQQHPTVEVVNVSASNSELNGQKGTVVAFDDNTGRYLTYLTLLRKTVSLKPANIVPPKGCIVVTYGLSAVQHNGKRGRVGGFDKTGGRLLVRTSKEESLKVKLENVRI